MPQVNVTIASRSYRMACGEGEEAHLEALAQDFDARVTELRGAFGEIGDMRLHVMASLSLADELAEARARAAALEHEMAALREAATAGESEEARAQARLAEGVLRAADRLERLARGLAAG